MRTAPHYSPYVIKMLKSFKSHGNIFLVFKQYGETLYNYKKKNNINANKLKLFSKQIALGLEFIHSYNIIHLDLKPENILIRHDKIKIIDFGSSVIEKGDQIKSYEQTRYYRAPEIVFELNTTVAVDVWSYGCILYKLATGCTLIPAKTTNDLMIYYTHIMGYPPIRLTSIYNNSDFFPDSHIKELYTFKCESGAMLYPDEFIWKCDNKEFIHLIANSCFVWDYACRSSMTTILKHPYFIE